LSDPPASLHHRELVHIHFSHFSCLKSLISTLSLSLFFSPFLSLSFSFRSYYPQSSIEDRAVSQFSSFSFLFLACLLSVRPSLVCSYPYSGSVCSETYIERVCTAPRTASLPTDTPTTSERYSSWFSLSLFV
jgi:hypothetical protein